MKKIAIIVIAVVMAIVGVMTIKRIQGESQVKAEEQKEEGTEEQREGEGKEEEQREEKEEVEIRIIDSEGEEVKELEIGEIYTLEIVRAELRGSKIMLDDAIEIESSEESEERIRLEIRIKPSEKVRIEVDEQIREYECKKKRRKEKEKIYYLTQEKEEAYKEGYKDYIGIEGYEVRYNEEEFREEEGRLYLRKEIDGTRIELSNGYEEVEVEIEVEKIGIEEIEVNIVEAIELGERFKIEVGVEPSYASEQGYEIRYDERYIKKIGEEYEGIQAGKSEIEIRIGEEERRYEIEIKGEEEGSQGYRIKLSTASMQGEGVEYRLGERKIEAKEGMIAQVRVEIEGYLGRYTIESENAGVNIYGSVIEIEISKTEVLSFKIAEIDLCFEIEVIVDKV